MSESRCHQTSLPKKKSKTQQLLKSFAVCVIPVFFPLCWFLSSYILFSNCHTALPPLNPPPRCLLPSLFLFSSQTSRTSCSETVFFNCLSVEYVDGQVVHSDRPRETDHTGITEAALPAAAAELS